MVGRLQNKLLKLTGRNILLTTYLSISDLIKTIVLKLLTQLAINKSLIFIILALL